MSEQAITHRYGGPFARMNWDSPAAVSELTYDGPARLPAITHVVLFGCGCASWLTFPRRPDGVLDMLDGDLWDGARVVECRRDGGMLVGPDGPLPSYMDCTHGGRP